MKNMEMEKKFLAFFLIITKLHVAKIALKYKNHEIWLNMILKR
jgi:hypothetical protein